MSRRAAAYALPAVLLALALTGCGGGQSKPASTLTEAQRDTALARSALPGAGVVQRALDVSGEARERAAGADSAAR